MFQLLEYVIKIQSSSSSGGSYKVKGQRPQIWAIAKCNICSKFFSYLANSDHFVTLQVCWYSKKLQPYEEKM